MPVTEQHLREHFRTASAPASVAPEPVVAAGHDLLRARRRRRAAGALAVAAVLGFVAVDATRPSYELAGSGLTLAEGSRGPVQVSDDRVDLGDGIQAWREGEVISIGYPSGPQAFLDTSDMTAQWGDLGYDWIVFDDPGQDDGSTAVVGTVRGVPSSVVVTLEGVSREATVVCFTEAEGWCSYKVLMPVSIASYGEAGRPTVRVS